MEEVKRNSLRAWILAARPKTLTGAVTPVLIGTALAAMDGHFHWLPALICCLFASLMQIAANFINDLFDFLKGTDREDRLGPERACAQGWISPQAMKTGIIITVALACLIGCTLLFFAGWELIVVGVLCVLFAFLYTTGPYPLSYNGWGDVLVVNNYRDREADARSGKRTVIVRFGEKFGRYFYLMLGVTASLLCLCFLREGHFLAALLPQLYLIPHFLTWKRMVKIYSGKKLNSILGETSRNMLFMGVLIAIGMLVS